MEQPEAYQGEVYEIIYSNEENGYCVFNLDAGDEGLITCVGTVPYIKEGELLTLTGKWTEHPSYGEQFKIEGFMKLEPSGTKAILSYLSAGIIKGIRRSTAEKIVDAFGENALTVIESQPERLAELKGISVKKANEISESYLSVKDREELVMFLQAYGISPSFAARVYDAMGAEAVGAVKENPYVLCEKIRGISFKSCDEIAASMGISANNINRVKSGIKYVLYSYAASGGHTCLPRDILSGLSAKALGINGLEVENAIVTLLMEQGLKNEYIDGVEAIFLPAFYECERSVAAQIKRLAAGAGGKSEDIGGIISELEAKNGITLEAKQREAVLAANDSNILVITGGPGTGKTTIINFIIQIYERLGLEVALTAPTGRAAKRMSALTGREAKTIHRLLEVGYGGDEILREYSRNQDLPLDFDAVIADEVSMLDVLLADSLLGALEQNAKLILVGDADQLPSVGAGNFLKDIIASKSVPVVRLDTVFRQAAESMIVVNAHKINAGEYPVYNQKDKDFYFVNTHQGPESVAAAVTELVSDRLPRAYGLDAVRDIQVITPTKKTAAGVIELNKRLQEALNPPCEGKAERVFMNRIVREGDKVMQIRNNYDLTWRNTEDEKIEGMGVFNGDMGIIEKVTSTSVTVIFDDEHKVKYENSQLEDIDHAYTVTVHKSQGSEFRAVVMTAFYGAPRLMNRNLIYTAVTRAKELVVIVGQKTAVNTMIDNDHEAKRYSSLCMRLTEKTEGA